MKKFIVVFKMILLMVEMIVKQIQVDVFTYIRDKMINIYSPIDTM